MDIQPADFPRLPADLETAIFRIIQEALTNVFRHSGAGKAWVTMEKTEMQISVSVRDDGKGISEHISQFQSGSFGIGIAGMRQRVKELGGDIRMRNVRPGTAVEIVIPISATSSPSAMSRVAQSAPKTA